MSPFEKARNDGRSTAECVFRQLSKAKPARDAALIASESSPFVEATTAALAAATAAQPDYPGPMLGLFCVGVAEGLEKHCAENGIEPARKANR